MAALAGLGETVGGSFLLLGLLTWIGTAAIIGVMVNAIGSVHAKNGPWFQNGGYEYPLVMMTAATALALAGPGRASLDRAIGWDMSGGWLAFTAVGFGVAAGVAVLGSRTVLDSEEERGRTAA
jgi:putative oxidoreductase